MKLYYDDTEALYPSVNGNFKSLKSRCGAVGIICDCGWGGEGLSEIFDTDTVSRNALYNEAFGKAVSEILLNAERVYVSRPRGGDVARSFFGEARYIGSAGNYITTACRAMSGDIDCLYEVCTYVKNRLADVQMVRASNELCDNEYVIFNKDIELFQTVGVPFTGGFDPTADIAEYRQCLHDFDGVDIDILICPKSGTELFDEFSSYVKERRDCGDALYGLCSGESSGSVLGVFREGKDTSGIVPYTAGFLAASEFYGSLKNRRCDEICRSVAYSDESEAEAASEKGIVFIEYDDGIYIRGESIGCGLAEGEITKRIRKLFESEYQEKALCNESGIISLKNGIRRILDGIHRSYGIFEASEILIEADGDGIIDVKIRTGQKGRCERFVFSAEIH